MMVMPLQQQEQSATTMRAWAGRRQAELQVGGWQLLVGIVGCILAAVICISAGREDGAADAVSGERELQPLQCVCVLAIIGEPEELVCVEGPDAAVDHHRLKL
jgi:hypothetical protein